MTLGERLRELRKTLGFTLESASEKLGVKKAYLSELELGKGTLRSDSERLAKIAEVYGESLFALQELIESVPVKLPYRGVVGAGPGRNEPGEFEMIEVPSRFKMGDGVYLVAGDSMKMAGIPDGARIVVRRNPAPEPGDTVVAWDDDKGMLVKRYASPPPMLLSFDGVTPPRTDLRNVTIYGVYLGVLDTPPEPQPKAKRGKK